LFHNITNKLSFLMLFKIKDFSFYIELNHRAFELWLFNEQTKNVKLQVLLKTINTFRSKRVFRKKNKKELVTMNMLMIQYLGFLLFYFHFHCQNNFNNFLRSSFRRPSFYDHLLFGVLQSFRIHILRKIIIIWLRTRTFEQLG
jgi:hypothetical protein